VALATTQRARLSPPVGSDTRSVRSIEAAEANHSIGLAIATDAARTVFPYSVIPGGVNSVDELRSAIATDAIVADHYKSFDLSRTHVERLTAPRFAYVSYRLGEHIYWTRNAVVLPAGERVITDGRNIARTRCGNQVTTRPGVTSPAEPSPFVLDTPTNSVAPCPTDPAACPPAAPAVLRGETPGNVVAVSPSGVGLPLGLPTAAIMPPPAIAGDIAPFNHGPNALGAPNDNLPIDAFVGPGAGPGLNPTVLTPVPEPSSLILMLTGAGGFLIRRITVKRRANRSDPS
jgi:hypothetical protein